MPTGDMRAWQAPLRIHTMAPDRAARLAGIFYLAIIGLGAFGELYVRGTLVVPRDPVATAANIQASMGLWRAGIAGDLLMQVLDVPVIVIFYRLFKSVDPDLALLAMLLNIVQTAVLAANKITLFVPVIALSGHAAGLSRQEADGLSFLAIGLHDHGFGIGLIFFGVTCLVQGYLILRCGFLPRLLGLLMAFAGASYLVNSLALILAPGLASAMFPAVLAPAFVGELALALWLTIKGVDRKAWKP